MRDYVKIGRVAKSHGVKGEICIDLNADSPELIESSIFLGMAGNRPREYEIAAMRMHHGRPLLLLKGVEERNGADLLRGLEVLIPSERLPELPEDEVYLSDLPGLEVFVAGTDGLETLLGRLESVDTPAGQEIWTIVTPGGREVLFPAAEEFVLSIDLAAGRTVINPPPGLLDIYLESRRS